MAVNNSNGEEEWEYEYSNTETETFYVDLDFSSVNDAIRSKNAGGRKSLKPSERGVQDGPATTGSVSRTGHDPKEVQDPGDHNENGDEAEEAEEEMQEPLSPRQAQSPAQKGLFDDNDDDNRNNDRVQILDLESKNPILSYNGSLYSCTWHDMLGTTMFVTKHQDAPFHEPEMSTEDYDLIGSSRIKLVGHRAKIVPKAASKKRRREDDQGMAEDSSSQAGGIAQYVPDGRSLGSIKRTNPRTNMEIKRQANFLEQLMEVKKARGEVDTVRTFVDRFTVISDAKKARQDKRKAKEKAETESGRLRREINELNQRVVKGDNDALERLQEIYAEMEEVEDEEDLTLVSANNATSSAPLEAEQNHGFQDGHAEASSIIFLRSDVASSSRSPPNGGIVTTVSEQLGPES